jgi:predicted nucleic acid-binding protein
MTAKATTLRYVLLDANIIIEAYRLGIWQNLTDRTEISVPSVVISDEALFYSRREGAVPKAIQLSDLVRLGKIREVTATTDQIRDVLSLFDRVFVQGIHAGELEALALMNTGELPDTSFCSADQVAIQALAMIGCADTGISMEKLLRQAGLQQSLERQFTDGFFRQHLELGKANRITGQGMRR